MNFEVLKDGKKVTPGDICKIKKQIDFAKEMHRIESDQFDFFHDYSKYLEVNNEILVLLAPDPVVEEQLALFKREKDLRLKMKEGAKSCFKCKFLHKIKKSQQTAKDLSKEYDQLKREYFALINDKSDKLKVIAFLSVVFSCRNKMIDETIPLRNQDG
ncbi:hypothetical protein FO519_002338 [Halicephalobus sp. NKZ332]|nr:hypothetical protein FO519_002338 [Halicephalobus sp. NKZ332]